LSKPVRPFCCANVQSVLEKMPETLFWCNNIVNPLLTRTIFLARVNTFVTIYTGTKKESWENFVHFFTICCKTITVVHLTELQMHKALYDAMTEFI
jgi:hypothetical protein